MDKHGSHGTGKKFYDYHTAIYLLSLIRNESLPGIGIRILENSHYLERVLC